MTELIVELTNVSLHREKPLLENLNWQVARGQHWVVLGRNGAGKTLLLRIIAGYLWPSRGQVRVLGRAYGQVDLRQHRRQLGWVSTALAEKIPLRDTVLEVILSGPYATFGLYETPPDELVSRARTLMVDMGLADLENQEFGSLSGGEKQRVVLARASLPAPELLILDEPCAGLDLAAREKFLALVSKLAADRAVPGAIDRREQRWSPEVGPSAEQVAVGPSDQTGPTLLMVTHRVSEIVPGFTHGLLISHGRFLASGPLDQVLTDELYSRTMELPVHLTHNNGRWQVQIG